MTSQRLQDRYRTTSEETLDLWQDAPDVGAVMLTGFYDPHKLALASGIRPEPAPAINALLQQLRALCADDPLADVMPPDGFHFTFLPVTPPYYSPDETPPGIDELLNLWRDYQGKPVCITELQLVALPNQLLLAGIPDTSSQMMREAFCASLLQSEWREPLIARHARTPLPAPFWHSTLLRYRAQYLPQALRQVYFRHQHSRFGDVAGALILARINYNWTDCRPVRPAFS